MDGSISMRKSKWVEIFLLSLLMMAVLCSCKKEDPKEYANTQIEMITSGERNRLLKGQLYRRISGNTEKRLQKFSGSCIKTGGISDTGCEET